VGFRVSFNLRCFNGQTILKKSQYFVNIKIKNHLIIRNLKVKIKFCFMV